MPSRKHTRQPRAAAGTPRAPAPVPSVAVPSAAVAPASGEVMRVASEADAETLARTLLDPARTRPVVVVSIPSGRGEPWIDVAEILSAVRGLARVAVVPTNAASWRLAELLPEKTQVYGGAGRVYPVGSWWQAEPARSPLRFAYGEHDAVHATESLIHDALGMAAAGRPPATTPPRQRIARGVVRRLVPPSRGLVQLEDGAIATIWAELTVPGVTIERLVAVGQPVAGALDQESKRLDVAGMRTPSDPLLPAYPEGAVVLTRVAEVRPDMVHLALLPDVVVPVPKDRVTSNPLDSMTALFTPGETVLARVGWRSGERVFLRLDDIDDDEAPRPAPALLAGGPPWLVVPEEVIEEVEESRPAQGSRRPPQPAGPVQAVAALPGEARRGATPRDLAAGRATAGLEAQLRAFQERARELEERVWQLEDKVRNQRTVLRKEKLRQQRAPAPHPVAERGAGAGPPAFLDREMQFRHEVYVEWVRRVPAGQKAERALAEYRIGPEFLASLDATEGVDRAKVVQVVVEVLTGLAEQLDGRDLHQLRASAGGNSPALTRDGGWMAWRVALQRETPAARRLHYWRLGKEFELARVATHDDLRV